MNQKPKPLLVLRYLWFMLTDFIIFFTDTIRNDQRIHLELNKPPHRNWVVSLEFKMRTIAILRKLALLHLFCRNEKVVTVIRY